MFKNRIIVGISDARMSQDIQDILVTYSLGSCIGVCMYDKNKKYAAMLHYQLPDSKIDSIRAEKEPFMFADTGMELLLNTMTANGCQLKDIEIKIVGGSEMVSGPKGFDIGKRNYLAIRKILWRKGMFIAAEEIGGSNPRNLFLDVDSGSVLVRSAGVEIRL